MKHFNILKLFFYGSYTVLAVVTMTLTEMPALIRERATRVCPLRAARWRGENFPLDSVSSSGQWDISR